MSRFEVETYTAPAHWAPYLFNGDSSGLEYSNTPDDLAGDRDIAAADAMIADIGLGDPVGCSEEEEFTPYPDYTTCNEYGTRLASGCLTYSFLRPVEPG